MLQQRVSTKHLLELCVVARVVTWSFHFSPQEHNFDKLRASLGFDGSTTSWNPRSAEPSKRTDYQTHCKHLLATSESISCWSRGRNHRYCSGNSNRNASTVTWKASTVQRLASTPNSFGTFRTSQLLVVSTSGAHSLRQDPSIVWWRWLCCLLVGLVQWNVATSLLCACRRSYTTDGPTWKLQSTHSEVYLFGGFRPFSYVAESTGKKMCHLGQSSLVPCCDHQVATHGRFSDRWMFRWNCLCLANGNRSSRSCSARNVGRGSVECLRWKYRRVRWSQRIHVWNWPLQPSSAFLPRHSSSQHKRHQACNTTRHPSTSTAERTQQPWWELLDEEPKQPFDHPKLENES